MERASQVGCLADVSRNYDRFDCVGVGSRERGCAVSIAIRVLDSSDYFGGERNQEIAFGKTKDPSVLIDFSVRRCASLELSPS